MPYGRTTLSKFIIDDQRRAAMPEVTSLLNDIQTACKLIAVAASRGALDSDTEAKRLDVVARDIMLHTCEWGGQLRAMASRDMDEVYRIPARSPSGRHMLVFDPFEGTTNIDINVPGGSVFSVLRCPDGVEQPDVSHFLQPGVSQVAAGYALYGPAAMIVLTVGAGVHGFTLDREIGAYTLTHPLMTIPPTTRDVAINAANQRHWAPPERRYVEECLAGSNGPRGGDFNMRWVSSMVAEVHRILVRGGLFMDSGDDHDAGHIGHPQLLFGANPLAMLVEQAGGIASTGRERILSVRPQDMHQCVSVILGSQSEVERLIDYHAEYDRGEDAVFKTPLFNVRSLFIGA